MTQNPTVLRTTRGIQQSLPIAPTDAPRLTAVEPKGVVYTKRWVVELLLDLAGYSPEVNLVDAVAVEPAAGSGAFLELLVERLMDSCQKLGRPILDCRDSLIAYELDGSSAAHMRGIATELLKRRGVQPPIAEELASAWVRNGDYLLEAPVPADFIIGNPPYVRLEDIPEETAALYRSVYHTMHGRADLYVAFFEAALYQLKVGGTCAFICADRWMRNQYGAELRRLITSEYALDALIEMHNADAFDNEVDAYPAITVIRRKKQGPTVVASAGPEVEKLPSRTLSDVLRAATGRDQALALQGGLRAAVVNKWIKGTDPWPCRSPEQLTLLRQLEERFPPLEANARVGIGVATGNDTVFITKDADLVEPSRLLKLALAKDIREGTMKWSGNYLVDPWNNSGLVDLDKYPRLGAYFEGNAAALKKRHTALKSTHGWYKTIDRVTHGLTSKKKLYIADIKDTLNPVLDHGETYPHHNLYFIQSDHWDLEVLGGLLLSALGQFFVESYGVRMRGGYLRFQAQYLRRIRVPDPRCISKLSSNGLVDAFRKRDRDRATQLALDVYGIDKQELERALEY